MNIPDRDPYALNPAQHLSSITIGRNFLKQYSDINTHFTQDMWSSKIKVSQAPFLQTIHFTV